jgi:hypothetical protein
MTRWVTTWCWQFARLLFGIEKKWWSPPARSGTSLSILAQRALASHLCQTSGNWVMADSNVTTHAVYDVAPNVLSKALEMPPHSPQCPHSGPTLQIWIKRMEKNKAKTCLKVKTLGAAVFYLICFNLNSCSTPRIVQPIYIRSYQAF